MKNKVESFDWRKVLQFQNAVWKVRGRFLVFTARSGVNKKYILCKSDLKPSTRCDDHMLRLIILSHISLKLQKRGRLLYKNIVWKQIVRRNCTNSLAMFWCDGFCAMVCLILLFVSLIIDWYFWTNHCSFKAPKLVMKTVGKVQWSKR